MLIIVAQIQQLFYNQVSRQSVRMFPVSCLDVQVYAQRVHALIMGAVRAERFCNGALLDFFKTGCILK